MSFGYECTVIFFIFLAIEAEQQIWSTTRTKSFKRNAEVSRSPRPARYSCFCNSCGIISVTIRDGGGELEIFQIRNGCMS